ncbi:Isochorismatase hydrolase [Eremomyces bilateralis CBS 781.70]|uniref:Isochorismatase hydrolase n=1 Tax=Eremomyces bilateralis CBS 781.70 TaxID=1392243 RepID=A0A6G1FVR6_9PEZI|nr:Isochorismatase hydrolase [Eremomyces bilateralis CBS 781.70]KAF1809995.1 Isochorismatase hydrolase [Eremomyces bilateralis CBS 781.70]
MSSAINPSFHPAYAKECGDPSRTKRLGFGACPAILFVDVCEAYFAPSSPLCLSPETVERSSTTIAALLRAARKTGITNKAGEPDDLPIIYAQTLYTHPDLRDAGLQAQKTGHASLFSSRNPERLSGVPHNRPALQPAPSDLVLAKKYPSPFFGTNLATQLTALGVDTLVIAGYMTSGSVRAAALDAMQAGFRAMVVADGCGDRGEETHWANLMDVGAKYGDVVTLEEADAGLKAGWGRS